MELFVSGSSDQDRSGAAGVYHDSCPLGSQRCQSGAIMGMMGCPGQHSDREALIASSLSKKLEMWTKIPHNVMDDSIKYSVP